MSEALQAVLKSAEGFYPPVFSYDRVERWPEGELNRCIAAGLLRPGQPAECVTCRECGETEVVVLIENSVTKEMCAYTSCLEVGPVQIPMERLTQWEMSYEQLMDVVFASVQLSGSREEIVRDRVWRLGRANWGGASRNVYFARGLQRRDAWQVMNQAKFSERSVVFVPARLPEEDSRIEVLPFVIPLTAVISWQGTSIHFDQEFVEAEIASAVARQVERSDSRQPPPSRGPRLALIEALTREMQEHLRAARDHALDTLDRTGTPKLLPRPQRDFLAKKLGVHKSRVTRAFAEEKAYELRLLWDLAADLDRILKHAGCRTRRVACSGRP
jgi:hypothetical protein